ncbi:MAG: diguanylate cyclase domain-containing protein, partial [Steroidobacteraceae bacterium]
MKAETGWAQKGGYLMRHPETGEVTGRTSWIANADWWRDRPRGMTEEQVHNAVDKALAGENLSPKQTRMVQFMADVHDERTAGAQTREELIEAVPTLLQQPATAADISTLAARAGDIDHEATARVLDGWGDDSPETHARVQGELQRIIGHGLEAQRASPLEPAGARGAPGEEGAPAGARFVADLERARGETDAEPSEEQKAAGNYAKGKLSFAPGLTVALENPKGSTRSGTEPDGTKWSRDLKNDYGYVLGTEGKDGDHVDAFLTGKPDTGKVFVVNQVDPETGVLDEHKLILGADSEDEARKTYLANYPRGWKGLGSIAEMSTADARGWLESGVRNRPARSTVRTERRVNPLERSRVAQMSPEELRTSLLTHELTGIPNRRAYRESEKLPAQVSVDANSLKWINDTGGHAAGDQVLRAIAQALHDETPHAYHFGGDEFAVQAESPEEAERIMARVRNQLAGARLTLEDRNGRKIELNGIGIAHGTGRTLEEADHALEGEKERQQAAGVRAQRGEAPPEAARGAAEEGPPARENRAAAAGSEGAEGEVAPARGLRDTDLEAPNHARIEEGQASYRGTPLPAAVREDFELSAPPGPQPGEVPTRPRAPRRAPRAGQLDLYTQRDTRPARAVRAVGSTLLREVGRFATGIHHVRSWLDAAHILAPLRRGPQETMAALVLDKDGKPIAVLRHTIGTSNAANVEFHTLIGAIARVPGAHAFYLAHNHPGG